MHSVELTRQRYLDLVYRYLQGRLKFYPFRVTLPTLWAEERQDIWRTVRLGTRAQRCLEREALEAGELPRAAPADPRRFCRMADRLARLCGQHWKEEPFRASVEQLFAAYRDPDAEEGEAQYVANPPRVYVFERPLPASLRHRYPFSAADIRKQMALVPEYDLEGLWSIGLCPLVRRKHHAYGTCYSCHYPERKPVIHLHSRTDDFEFKLRQHCDSGYIEHFYRVELDYGMQVERRGSITLGRWPAEGIRRYIAEHVLLHEIGHHVQYQQRVRARHWRWLPHRQAEQFADDYAIRFVRERRE